MNLCSIGFLIFVIACVFIYWCVKKSWRPFVLLAASYIFYAYYSVYYMVLMLAVTAVSYICGRMLEKKASRLLLGTALVLNFAPLIFFKVILIPELDINLWNLALPVGLSFYSFKVTGYLIDVYRGDAKAETSFVNYALFVSFFAEIMTGPIDRAGGLLAQIDTLPDFDFDKIKSGAILMAYGYFEKMVVADRIGLLVDAVYSDIDSYAGVQIILAVLLYSMQIYLDFEGCTNIARGCGAAFGFDLAVNFREPYLAQSVAGFWRRWHMSLTEWFKDYLYIPLGGSRKGRIRKYINIMIVFAVSGIWHGNGASFIVWGLLNGAYQVVGDILKPLRDNVRHLLRIGDDAVLLKPLRIVVTYIFISISWIFFRAESITQAITVMKRAFAENNIWYMYSGDAYNFALSAKNWNLLLVCLVIIFIIDIRKNAGSRIRDAVISGGYVLQLIVIYALIFSVIIFGIYGAGYNAADFIYVNF